MPTLTHAQGKAPHIVLTAAASASAGLVQLITGDLPPSINAASPQYVAHMWSALLVLGGVTALIGIFLKEAVLGLKLEQAGHVGLLMGSLVYVIAIIEWSQPPWWPSPAVWWGVALVAASIVRWLQIWRTLRAIDKVVARVERQVEDNIAHDAAEGEVE